MIFVRNVLIGVLWFIFISGSYVGWAALGVLAKLDRKASFTPSEIGWWVGSAVVPWGTVIPLVVVALGFWFGFLPGFKRNSAVVSNKSTAPHPNKKLPRKDSSSMPNNALHATREDARA